MARLMSMSMSITDRIIREAHQVLQDYYAPAGAGEILDHLAWEVGSAASGLIKPAPWVRQGLLKSGLSANLSEAQARIARIISQHISTLSVRELLLSHSFEQQGIWEQKDIHLSVQERDRMIAVAHMEAEIGRITLPIHARLESCSIEELNQASITMLTLGREYGNPDIIEDIIVSLLIFSDEIGHDRWWDKDPYTSM